VGVGWYGIDEVVEGVGGNSCYFGYQLDEDIGK